jgi:uncharacterized membrane protein
VGRPREQVEHYWHDDSYRPGYIKSSDAAVRFLDAPGDRGTEIHVELDHSTRGGKLGDALQRLMTTDALQRLMTTVPLAKVKDDLRHFKQLVETGEVARSDAVPEGERMERKLKQRPAQPLPRGELQKAGV